MRYLFTLLGPVTWPNDSGGRQLWRQCAVSLLRRGVDTVGDGSVRQVTATPVAAAVIG